MLSLASMLPAYRNETAAALAAPREPGEQVLCLDAAGRPAPQLAGVASQVDGARVLQARVHRVTQLVAERARVAKRWSCALLG